MKFYPGNIYHVKIAQHSIRSRDTHIDYFPYDNVYIAHRNDEPRIQQLFRYYLVMDYTEIIAKMLNCLHVEREKTVRVRRDDLAFEGTTLFHKKRFNISRPEDWLLIVPTHVKARTRKGHKVPDISEIGYIMSEVVGVNANAGIKLPPISIQTPDDKIPLLCSICANLPKYYAGQCLPGTSTCRNDSKTRLPLDKDLKQAYDKSVQEVEVT